MPNEIKSFDGREALDEFLKAALPRANFVIMELKRTIR